MLTRGSGVCKGPVAGRIGWAHPHASCHSMPITAFLPPAHWLCRWFKVKGKEQREILMLLSFTSATIDGKGPASNPLPC